MNVTDERTPQETRTPSGFVIDRCGYCFIPEGVTCIPYHEFMGTNVIHVHLPSTMRVIGASAFRECESLTTVIMNDGLEAIEHSAFERCWMLSSIKLPESLRVIESSAFEKCVSLTAVDLPDSLAHIGSLAFSDCTNLESVHMGCETTLGDAVFLNTEATIEERRR